MLRARTLPKACKLPLQLLCDSIYKKKTYHWTISLATNICHTHLSWSRDHTTSLSRCHRRLGWWPLTRATLTLDAHLQALKGWHQMPLMCPKWWALARVDTIPLQLNPIHPPTQHPSFPTLSKSLKRKKVLGHPIYLVQYIRTRERYAIGIYLSIIIPNYSFFFFFLNSYNKFSRTTSYHIYHQKMFLITTFTIPWE